MFISRAMPTVQAVKIPMGKMIARACLKIKFCTNLTYNILKYPQKA